MRKNGLMISYEDGIVTVIGEDEACYPVGELLCRIFQGESLDNIRRRLRNCINFCPMDDMPLIQDSIEAAEEYVCKALLIDDFYPARRLAQGSFIRCAEDYRALDAASQDRLLELEKSRAAENDNLYSRISFDTVGDFLRLCYNNYYIDLVNAIDLFSCVAAVRTGTAKAPEMLQYRQLCRELARWDAVPGINRLTSYDLESRRFHNRYVINSFLAMAVFEISHIDSSATKMMRCQNPACGLYFTAKRTTAMYCHFPAPQRQELTCSKYYPQIARRQRQRADNLCRMEKQALGRLYNDRRRHPDAKDEVNELIDKIYMETRREKERVMAGELSEADYKNWLDGIRRKGARRRKAVADDPKAELADEL